MSHNDALDFAQRLYSRLPAHYRVYDAERGQPLYALLTVVGAQAANIRADLDTLWDNFFIETCEDWVVPYLGALAGTNLLTTSVGQSSRLDVWNTVQWRRSKGTPGMLQSLAQSITGWPAGMVEFYASLGWSQNMNHLQPNRQLTPDLRKQERLALLNRAGDGMAHAADFQSAPPLAEPRGALGSRGRYNIGNAGFFVSRLQIFPVSGVTPAASAPGTVPPAGNSTFTFNPLFRDVPLFSGATGGRIEMAAFNANPWSTFGNDADIAVRQFGVLLAADSAPTAVPAAADFKAFTFGGAAAGLVLDSTSGLRLMGPERFQMGATRFTVTAQWKNGAVLTGLGSLSTGKPVFTPGGATPGAGQLVIQVSAGSRSPSVWFPGAVMAVRKKAGALLRSTDAAFVYLPPAKLPASFDIAEDGSSFVGGILARASEGQVYPPRALTRSTHPADGFVSLHKKTGATLADQARYGNAVQFQVLADVGNRLLSVALKPKAGGTFIPPAELIVKNRAGESLLVYLPEVAVTTAAGVTVFVADDGATWFVPTDPAVLLGVQIQHSFSGLVLARAAAGQALPIAGLWPLQQRRPVGMNLCSPLRSALLAPDQLGIDPERGRFALPAGDPALAAGSFSVDYIEAFSGPVGALNYDRELDPLANADIVVSQSGDADTAVAVFSALSDAIAAAHDGDIVEIADSATYASLPVAMANPSVRSLTIRAAAGQRPCLLFYGAGGVPAASSLSITTPMTSLKLNGLLLSGGPLVLQKEVQQLSLVACSLDPEPGIPMVNGSDAALTSRAIYVLSGCITGGITAAAGVTQLTVVDSIVDAKSGSAIAAARTVQLERTTVIGRITANVLTASECLLNDVATVQDRQSGCVRFTRFEVGSVLPRRYRSIPDDDQLSACPKKLRCLAPVFHSKRFGRPDYCLLSAACASEVLAASESGAEVGVFSSGMNTIRLRNLRTKLQEFMPVGLVAVLIAEA